MKRGATVPWLRAPVRRAARSAATALGLGGSAFTVGFRRATVEGEAHFVPRYAETLVVCRQTLRGKRYEPQTHRFVAAFFAGRSSGAMVHAGAYFGDMLPSFARSCPGTLHAFEPVLEHYLLARLCIDANGLDRVLLLNAGLGAAHGPAFIDTGTPGRHRGGTARVARTGQRAVLLPLDSLRLEGLALIHLDLEGHEREALEGAVETLARERPVLMIEDNPGLAAPFLANRDYSPVGSIPGLTIWATPAQAVAIAALLAAL